jgi:hypothetical protein
VVNPELVAQIEFLEWTESDHLRHAKFVGLCEDKDPRSVIKEQSGGTTLSVSTLTIGTLALCLSRPTQSIHVSRYLLSVGGCVGKPDIVVANQGNGSVGVVPPVFRWVCRHRRCDSEPESPMIVSSRRFQKRHPFDFAVTTADPSRIIVLGPQSDKPCG